MEAREYAKQAYLALEDKLGKNIKVIDISEVSCETDYLVIADGRNHNQVQALCKSVEGKLSEVGATMKNREGDSKGGWILLDFYDIIVHIFSEEIRDFYDLEHIWRDGKICSIEEL